MIKVSIIVPFHNVENYISKCLTSLMYQSLEDIEIICVDDASTDNSTNIVKSYAENDDRIKIITVETMQGQSHARNLGLEVATGEYIGFVDSDDWVELDMFEKMYQRAKEQDTDITMCKAQLFDDKEQSLYSDDYYSLKMLEKMGENLFSPEDTKDEILNINVVLWNKIYKRDFLNSIEVKFQDGYIYEDMPFFFETYLQAKKVNIIWESLYFYRQNRRFSTMQNSDKKIYDRIPMVQKTYEVLKQSPFYEEKQLDILCWIIDDVFHRYTLLEEKYYQEYYNLMRNLFLSLEISEELKPKMDVSYCYEEFCNVLECNYFEFWRFLIEKYKSSNRVIKAVRHENNESLAAMQKYVDENIKKTEEEKARLDEWWKNHCKETLETLEKEHAELKERHIQQEYALKSWQAESVKQVTEKLTADYEWKLQEQRQHFEESLAKQKEYYENNYFLVKIVLKFSKKYEQLKNRVKNILKKN